MPAIEERFSSALADIRRHHGDVEDTSYLIAYSGGMDSHVLLHLCAHLGLKCRAIHINHGLQTESDGWERHCLDVCSVLNVELVIARVDVGQDDRRSPEEAARDARYAAFAAHIRDGECLLLAQHRDDQAETFLLQLMRGAGPAGLAAMPVYRTFGVGGIGRPLLDIERDELRSYAATEKLEWIDDPSNSDPSIDRNFLRHHVMPVISQRWRNASGSIATAAEQQAAMLELSEQQALTDLAYCTGSEEGVLMIARLNRLSAARQRNALRYWIERAGFGPVSRNILDEILDVLILAAADADPVVRWRDAEVRRHAGQLHILNKPSPIQQEVRAFDAEIGLRLEEIGARITVMQNVPAGIDTQYLGRSMEVRFRQGGERIRVAGHQHTAKLKQLFQDQGVPSWQRGRIPLLYIDGELAAVCGYWIADAFSAEDTGWVPVVTSVV